MRQNKFHILILVLGICIIANSQENQRKWTLNGYLKNMQTIMMEDINKPWITDNLLHNRLNFKWYINNNFTTNMEIRNRFFYGEMVTFFDGVNFPINYKEITDVENGWVDLSGILAEGDSYFLHSSIDRLWVDYSKGNYQLTLGRQRINWGQTFVWNPNDIFNAYSFFDFDYEERPGSDAIRFQYYLNATSGLELAAKVNNKDKLTAALLYRINRWKYDFQFLSGILNEQDIILGAGWSGQLLKGGFRGEASYFHPREIKDTSGVFMASLGYDFSFKKGIMAQFEILYNSNGKIKGEFDFNEFYFNELSAKNLSLNRVTLFSQISVPVSPLITTSFSAMYSPNDKSVYLGPSIAYSLKANLDISFILQYFSGDGDGQIQNKGAFSFLRLKWSF